MQFLKKLDQIVAAILKAVVVTCLVLIAVILLFRVIIRFTPINISRPGQMKWSSGAWRI